MQQNKKNISLTKATRLQSKRGFTLLEVIVALFVFSVAMVAVTGIFVSFFKANTQTKTTQKALEDANQAINIMTKMIRTSSVSLSGNVLKFYEYSDDGTPDKCRAFRFDAGTSRIQYAAPASASDAATCFGLTPGGYANIIDTPVTGSFFVTPSAGPPAPVVGKVTILMTAGGKQIQSSVSLRDYSVSKN